MLDILKVHWHDIVQSAFDTKSVTATALTAGSATAAIAAETSSTITLNDVSIMAAIFAGSCTGIYMLTNVILNAIKIKKELKDDNKCEPD